MNTDDNQYSLTGSYIPVGGGSGEMGKHVEEFAKKMLGDHCALVVALLILLIVVLIYFMMRKKSEHFNPTATLRMQQRDGIGESLAGDRNHSAFAQHKYQLGDPAPGEPAAGSTIMNVLNGRSADFNCNGRNAAGSDAWDWMNHVAHEKFSGGQRPTNDSDFSRVLAGQ